MIVGTTTSEWSNFVTFTLHVPVTTASLNFPFALIVTVVSPSWTPVTSPVFSSTVTFVVSCDT